MGSADLGIKFCIARFLQNENVNHKQRFRRNEQCEQIHN